MRQKTPCQQIEVALTGLGVTPHHHGLLARWLGTMFQFGATFSTGLTARTKALMALGGVNLA